MRCSFRSICIWINSHCFLIRSLDKTMILQSPRYALIPTLRSCRMVWKTIRYHIKSMEYVLGEGMETSFSWYWFLQFYNPEIRWSHARKGVKELPYFSNVTNILSGSQTKGSRATWALRENWGCIDFWERLTLVFSVFKPIAMAHNNMK